MEEPEFQECIGCYYRDPRPERVLAALEWYAGSPFARDPLSLASLGIGHPIQTMTDNASRFAVFGRSSQSRLRDQQRTGDCRNERANA